MESKRERKSETRREGGQNRRRRIGLRCWCGAAPMPTHRKHRVALHAAKCLKIETERSRIAFLFFLERFLCGGRDPARRRWLLDRAGLSLVAPHSRHGDESLEVRLGSLSWK